jgi:hypothetical protein
MQQSSFSSCPKYVGYTRAAPLGRCARHDVGYVHGAQSVHPHPPCGIDGVPRAQGACSDGLTKDGLGPGLARMRFPPWETLWQSFVKCP